jgi:hypothetical protein
MHDPAEEPPTREYARRRTVREHDAEQRQVQRWNDDAERGDHQGEQAKVRGPERRNTAREAARADRATE